MKSNVSNDYLIPVKIETDRLILRMFKDDDWHALHEHYSDAECTKYTYRKVLTEGETWRTMSSLAGQWVLKGYGPYVLEEKKSGLVLGVIGLWFPNDWPEPEIMWLLIRKYWGKGFAIEAALAVQKMASKYLPEVSLISLIDSNNEASIRLAKTVGATFEKELQLRGGLWHIYRHPKR